MLRPEYREGSPCGNCILLKSRITQPDYLPKLEETLRLDAAKYLPAEHLAEVRIVREAEAPKYWPKLPTTAIGWVYEPAPKQKKKKSPDAI